MIKRKYFFKVESKYILQKDRREQGLITCCTGTITSKSWNEDYTKLFPRILKLASDQTHDFNVDDLILTSLNRL